MLLSELIKEKEKKNQLEEIESIKQISPTAWQHINFMGRYEFNKPTEKINVLEIVKEMDLIALAQTKIPYWYFSWVWAEIPKMKIFIFRNCRLFSD